MKFKKADRNKFVSNVKKGLEAMGAVLQPEKPHTSHYHWFLMETPVGVLQITLYKEQSATVLCVYSHFHNHEAAFAALPVYISRNGKYNFSSISDVDVSINAAIEAFKKVKTAETE